MATITSYFKKSPTSGEKTKRKAEDDAEEVVEDVEGEEKVVTAKRRKNTTAKGKEKVEQDVESDSAKDGANDVESDEEETKKVEKVKASAPKELANKDAQNMYQYLTEPTWRDVLHTEFTKPYFIKLAKYVAEERSGKTKIFPPENMVFNALNACSFDKVRVVILGQDPYIKPGQAMGLSFSVPAGVTVPPSLKNMYKELEEDSVNEFKAPKHGDLTAWAKQGVLMLNTVMTVQDGKSNSHAKQGWEIFTSAIIDAVNAKSKHGVVFLLWGLPSQKCGAKLNPSKHHILKAAHPSPLSARNGFFGCKHFSKCNKWLKDNKMTPINWQN